LVLVYAFSFAQAMPPVQRSVLPNGLVLLSAEEHSLPFVTVQVLVHAGARLDPPGQGGLASMTARALLFGTEKRGLDVINEQLDFMGASLSADAGRDYAVISLRVLTKDFSKGFALLMEVLEKPLFPDSEIEKEVTRTLAAIRAQEDDPAQVAEREFIKALYGNGPYAQPVMGTTESVKRLNAVSVKRFHRDFYGPRNTIFVIVGNFDPVLLAQRIAPQLATWRGGETVSPPVDVRYERRSKRVTVDRALTQSNIIRGHEGITRDNPDYYAVTVMNYILGGGGLTTRLMEQIRDKRGLAYSVFSHFAAGKYEGSFRVVLQTKNASAREAVKLVTAGMERIREKPVSDAELQSAKKYLIGSFPLRLTTQGAIASYLMQVEHMKLGHDYAERYPKIMRDITVEDVQRAARAYLHPDRLIVVVVGNLKEAGFD
ncbi:MAG: pitrilysin family protein, partial [candidate division WOR-3 bacterium]